jgi:predicted amidophosphoribosyltransferase
MKVSTGQQDSFGSLAIYQFGLVNVKKSMIPIIRKAKAMPMCQICGRENAEDARFCFSCGTALSQTPPVKVEVKSSLVSYPAAPMVPPIYAQRQLPRPGTCYYHPDLPSSFVCSRCGRSICAGCNKPYGVLSFCPECFWGLAPKIGYPQPQYQQNPTGYQYPGYQPQEQGRSLF